jgi:ABC-type sulfate transport system permease subunit
MGIVLVVQSTIAGRTAELVVEFIREVNSGDYHLASAFRASVLEKLLSYFNVHQKKSP